MIAIQVLAPDHLTAEGYVAEAGRFVESGRRKAKER